jgi:hypothetical protein
MRKYKFHTIIHTFVIKLLFLRRTQNEQKKPQTPPVQNNGLTILILTSVMNN